MPAWLFAPSHLTYSAGAWHALTSTRLTKLTNDQQVTMSTHFMPAPTGLSEINQRFYAALRIPVFPTAVLCAHVGGWRPEKKAQYHQTKLSLVGRIDTDLVEKTIQKTRPSSLLLLCMFRLQIVPFRDSRTKSLCPTPVSYRKHTHSHQREREPRGDALDELIHIDLSSGLCL